MNLLTRGLLCAIHMRFDDRLQIEDKAYIDEFGEPDFERETQKFNSRLSAIEKLRKSAVLTALAIANLICWGLIGIPIWRW